MKRRLLSGAILALSLNYPVFAGQGDAISASDWNDLSANIEAGPGSAGAGIILSDPDGVGKSTTAFSSHNGDIWYFITPSSVNFNSNEQFRVVGQFTVTGSSDNDFFGIVVSLQAPLNQDPTDINMDATFIGWKNSDGLFGTEGFFVAKLDTGASGTAPNDILWRAPSEGIGEVWESEIELLGINASNDAEFTWQVSTTYQMEVIYTETNINVYMKGGLWGSSEFKPVLKLTSIEDIGTGERGLRQEAYDVDGNVTTTMKAYAWTGGGAFSPGHAGVFNLSQPNVETRLFTSVEASENLNRVNYPSLGAKATIAYEDNYPYQGDFDMNDTVIDIQTEEWRNSGDGIVSVQVIIDLVAKGGDLDTGLALKLPNVDPTNVSTARLILPNSTIVNDALSSAHSSNNETVVILTSDSSASNPSDDPSLPHGLSGNYVNVVPATEADPAVLDILYRSDMSYTDFTKSGVSVNSDGWAMIEFCDGSNGGWTSASCSAEWHGESSIYGASVLGNGFVELDSTSATHDVWTLDVSASNSNDFELMFYAQERSGTDGSDDVEIYWGGSLIQTINPTPMGQYYTISLGALPTSSGSVVIQEAARQSNGGGALIHSLRFTRLKDVEYYTQQTYGTATAEQFIVYFEFEQAVDSSTLVAPYDPYIYASSSYRADIEAVRQTDGGLIEVHMVDIAPTSLASVALLGQFHDGYTVENGMYYRDYENLPFAIHLPSQWDQPREHHNIINAYLTVKPWAQSGGTQYTDWYSNAVQCVSTKIFERN